MKININGKNYNWNCKVYGNIQESVKVYLSGKENIFSLGQWNDILKSNKINDKVLEVESLITDFHGKFNKFLYVFGDLKIDKIRQKKELKKIFERLSNKIQDNQLKIALDIFIKVNYDD